METKGCRTQSPSQQGTKLGHCTGQMTEIKSSSRLRRDIHVSDAATYDIWTLVRDRGGGTGGARAPPIFGDKGTKFTLNFASFRGSKVSCTPKFQHLALPLVPQVTFWTPDARTYVSMLPNQPNIVTLIWNSGYSSRMMKAFKRLFENSNHGWCQSSQGKASNAKKSS